MTSIDVRRLLATIFLVMGVSSLAMARSPEMAEAWNAPAIAWQDIKSGVRDATLSQRPVIMVFHAPWCGSCRKFREVFKDPAVVEEARNFVMILVDADADKVSNGAFAPDGTYVPRTIFLDWEGNIRSDIRGATDPEHPQTIDISGPAELLSLMRKAVATMPRPAPGQPSDGQQEASAN